MKPKVRRTIKEPAKKLKVDKKRINFKKEIVVDEVLPKETTKKLSKKDFGTFEIINAVLTVLAHIVVALLIILSGKYYRLQIVAILGLMGVVICLLLINDVLFYVGIKYRDKTIKIINCVLASLLFLTGTVGSFYIGKLNHSVNKIVENSGTDQYETIGGVFTYYDGDDDKTTYEDLDDLKSVSNLTVGVLYDDGVGTGTMAKEILEKNNIDAEYVTYNANDDLLSALVGNDEDNSVDIAVFPASYRQRLESDEEVDYSQYLDDMVDFYSFEDKVKTDENEAANQDLSSEPFNILLIGFAPENEQMTYGLADTIIVATVNPQTFTVTMTSIARDSYVPISCYGGSRDKINAARGTSRACLMDTVGDLLDLDINYYMEVNFLGVVEIVDAVGGIVINNPVTFVGQSASTNRGEMTVLVPAGEEVVADGEMALAFARERHAMPGGDFDRQLHQQQVIAAVAEKLLSMKDVNQALKVMEAAGDNISTNLSISQLTGVFNYLISADNYTGLTTFNMLDIQNMRVTGYSSWHYNYSMNLPLWIYKLYNGSIDETKDRIDITMGNYSTSDIVQPSYMKFMVEYPYTRGQLYSDYFDEEQEHEDLPDYYPNLTKYTYTEAMAWAAENGVTLNVTFISEDDSNYVASEDGYVVEQSPKQGALISDYPVGSITVMGTQDPNYVPSYTVEGCDDKESCIAFATKNGIAYTEDYKYFTDTENYKEGAFAGTNYTNGQKIKKNETLIIYSYKKQTTTMVTLPTSDGIANNYETALSKTGLVSNPVAVSDGASNSNNGQIIKITDSKDNIVTPGSSSVALGSTINVYYYSYSSPTTTAMSLSASAIVIAPGDTVTITASNASGSISWSTTGGTLVDNGNGSCTISTAIDSSGSIIVTASDSLGSQNITISLE